MRISNSTYAEVNITFNINPLNDFKTKNRIWDYIILDKQLEEI